MIKVYFHNKTQHFDEKLIVLTKFIINIVHVQSSNFL